jgi:hypothetical protein
MYGTADSNRAEGSIFFKRAKHIIGDFEGFSEEGQDFFDSPNCPEPKNLKKSTIMCFASMQK